MNTQHRHAIAARRRRAFLGCSIGTNYGWQRLEARRERARVRRALLRGQREAHRQGLSVRDVMVTGDPSPRWLCAYWINPDAIEVVPLRLFGGVHIDRSGGDRSEETPW